jgi:hypothetical protein
VCPQLNRKNKKFVSNSLRSPESNPRRTSAYGNQNEGRDSSALACNIPFWLCSAPPTHPIVEIN